MMKRFYRFLCCLLALALLTAPCAFAAVTGYVTANTMNVYQYPSPLSKKLGTMTYGEDVLVLSIEDNWMRVQNHKGDIGYCETGSLSKTNPALDMYGYVKETGGYVYAKPGYGFKVIAKVEMGDELHVVGMTKDGQWLRLKSGSLYGYIPTVQVSKTPTWFGLIDK